jgi:hypothetical protein
MAFARLAAVGQRSGKKELFSFHLNEGFLWELSRLFDRKKAQSGKKRAFLTLR